ncbi:MAG: hypothetical protein WC570_05065, partial [Patescibacteria group bacterium]
MTNGVDNQNLLDNQVEVISDKPETGKITQVLEGSTVTPDNVTTALEEAQKKVGGEVEKAVNDIPGYMKKGYEMFGDNEFVKEATEKGLKDIPEGEEANFAVVMLWGYPGQVMSVDDWNSKTDAERKMYIEQYSAFKKINVDEKVVDENTENKEETKKPETYKGMPVEDYLKKKLDAVDVSLLSEENGKEMKEFIKKMPIENVNGFVYGVNQITEKIKQAKVDLAGGKINQEEYDKLKKSYQDRVNFGAKVCGHDYGTQVENMKKKIPAEILEKNPKLLEVGFLGTSEGRDEYLKKVEQILSDSGVKGNEAYWYTKTLLNMKGYEHSKPEPKPAPKPAPTETTTTTPTTAIETTTTTPTTAIETTTTTP